MYYHQDWILRQIQILINLIKGILSKGASRQINDTGEDNEIKVKIEYMIKNYELIKAEEIILKDIDQNKQIEMALWFYENLNTLSDSELEKGQFNRNNILKSMKKICIDNNLLDETTIDFLLNSEND